MQFPVRVTKRTPGMIVPDGQVHGRFYEPGDTATGEAAKVVLEWGCGEEIVPERQPATDGKGDAPEADGLDDMTVVQLRELATAAGIDFAGLKKAELIEALRAASATPKG